jgi:hypothetical protein
MSQQDAGARPSQVTIAGWVIAVASVMLVVSVFDTMGNLNSVDTRDQVTRALTTGSARDLGLSVDDALEVMRWSLFVSGAAAAVTAILGIFVLQRHTAARVVLTVAAVPVVLTSPFSGGFLGVLVGASAAMLWTRPARDWFAGRPVTQTARSPFSSRAREETPRERPVPPAFRPLPPPGVVDPADRPDSSEPAGEAPPPPPPMPGWGGPAGPAPTSAAGSVQSGHAVAADWPPPYAHAPATPSTPSTLGTTQQVPSQVRVACILTWIFAGLSAAGYVLLGVAIAIDRGEMLELMRENASVQDSSLSDDTLIAALVVVSALTVIWCLAACGLAVLVWRRSLWAWRLLLVSIGVAALVCLLALPLSLVHFAACGVTFGLLVRPSTRAWIRGGNGPVGPGPGPQGGLGSGAWQPPTGSPRDVPTPQPGDKPPVW